MSFFRPWVFLLLPFSGAAAALAQAPAGTLPAVLTPIPSTTVGTGSAITIDLGTVFGLPGVSGPVVQFTTVVGPVNVELYNQVAPLNTANFLGYVNSGAYTNTLFNRAIAGFVLQGGTYTLMGNSFYTIPTGAPVANEYNISNTRGTLAMALEGTDPNSATCTWFFNLADNSANLNVQDGGFTVFGRVIGTGMTVIDPVGAGPEYDLSATLGGAFTNTPLINYMPPIAEIANFVLIPTIAPISIYPPNAVTAGVLSFSASSSNSAMVNATASGRSLLLAAGGAPGSASVTVTATDSNGNQATTTFIATVANSLAISRQPASQTVASGSTAVFSLGVAAAPAAAFQWSFNGVPIANATGARLVVNGATAANAGSYTCAATNLAGIVTSQAATLAVAVTANPGRLGNLSVLSNFTAGQMLTVGFVTGGAGTSGTQSLLIRADGPTLASFNVAGAMADPKFQVIPLGQTTVVAANDNWGTPAGNSSPVIAADSATGAFSLVAGSLDAAEVVSLTSGGYSVQVSGTGAGTALTELYDTTPAAAYTLATPRLVNVSCNTTLGTGGTLTVGFTVGGSTSKTVLIRASGPTLAGFGLTGVIPDPQIVVQALGSSTALAANAGWGGDPQIAAAASSVSAFPFASATSADSAVLITLAPGGYTAVASGVTGDGGTTVVEVYEIP